MTVGRTLYGPTITQSYKTLLFVNILEGFYSMSNRYAAFKPGQFTSFSELITKALASYYKQTPGMVQIIAAISGTGLL